jgi:hypothetical protein
VNAVLWLQTQMSIFLSLTGLCEWRMTRVRKTFMPNEMGMSLSVRVTTTRSNHQQPNNSTTKPTTLTIFSLAGRPQFESMTIPAMSHNSQPLTHLSPDSDPTSSSPAHLLPLLLHPSSSRCPPCIRGHRADALIVELHEWECSGGKSCTYNRC